MPLQERKTHGEENGRSGYQDSSGTVWDTVCLTAGLAFVLAATGKTKVQAVVPLSCVCSQSDSATILLNND